MSTTTTLSPLPLARWEAMGTRRQVRNRKLFVVDVGPREDETPIVLVHGFPTSSWDFTPLLAPLAGRRVIAFDLLGYGLSEKPWPHEYSLVEQSDFLAALLSGLGVKRAHLVAHDMGDTVVQELLGRRIESAQLVPFEIASVTLLNGGILVDRVRPILSQKLLRTLPGRVLSPLLPRALSRRAFDASLRRIAGPDRPPPDDELDTQFALVERDDGRRLLPHLIGYMREREIHRKRWRRALLTHPFPMLLLWGDRDPINPWSTVEEIIAERPATEAVRLPRIGHYPQLEAPAEVAHRVLDFVGRVARAGAGGA
ncbi:MAG: alpha/beta fold hydrolase [Myxococcales bacterium]|nr:alpha/beta fold hydrolase [Myxococcales bacterium]